MIQIKFCSSRRSFNNKSRIISFVNEIVERVIKESQTDDIRAIFFMRIYPRLLRVGRFPEKHRDFLCHKSKAIEDIGIRAVTMFLSRFRLI